MTPRRDARPPSYCPGSISEVDLKAIKPKKMGVPSRIQVKVGLSVEWGLDVFLRRSDRERNLKVEGMKKSRPRH